MDGARLKAYCLAKQGVTSGYPFGEGALVFKVMNKMFMIMPDDLPKGAVLSLTLKCDPVWAEVLRQTYSAVKPGYHTNKRHWNTVTLDGSVPDDEVLEMIDHSYDQVVRGLSKAEREKLKGQNEDT